MRLPFKIAVRFLKSNLSQTILIFIGISIGVSVQVFLGSLIQGLQKDLVETTVGNSPHITIEPKDDDLIEDWTGIVKKIRESSFDTKAVSVSADSPGFINYNDKTESVLVRGFLPEEMNDIYSIKDNLIDGSIPDSEGEVIIGKDLALELDISVGDNIEIITPKREIVELKITGLYDLKVSSINKLWIITNLQTSQNIFDYDNSVTSIEIQVNNVFEAGIIADDIEKILNPQLKIQNWKEQNEQLLSGLRGQSISSIMIQVFVMISVLLAIASVLAISVVQRSKQIGILKAMGINDKSSSMIFIYQGLILGIIGAFVGISLGLGLSFMFTKFAVNPDGTPVVNLRIDYSFIVLSAVIAVVASVIASLIPAKNTSKLNPIEVIRNG
ncbi:ABC transporter permease [Herbivorax sp. ANBcel31]|uniref:ABC transporter permease n=1 Tax=Herbivorax sp. ANBcel31 TaxID=3069754 RepID=UPI0027B0FCB4|nr:ABC transporter permease [Herbivorax sp. ANBcel31]MDQ2087419.1 ABC transporter permease [Herbivorax sp. ANBcel31]